MAAHINSPQQGPRKGTPVRGRGSRPNLPAGFMELITHGNAIDLSAATDSGAASRDTANPVGSGSIDPVVVAFGMTDLAGCWSCRKSQRSVNRESGEAVVLGDLPRAPHPHRAGADS